MDLYGKDVLIAKADFSIAVDDIATLMCLYQPLLSKTAVQLYLALAAQSQQVHSYETHMTLLAQLHVTIDEFSEARTQLSHFLLLKTFVSQKEHANVYCYALYPPKRAAAFLRHDLFARLLLEEMGESYVRKQMQRFCTPIDRKEFTEMTVSFVPSFAQWDVFKEEQYAQIMEDVPMTDKEKDPYAAYPFLRHWQTVDPKGFLLPYDAFSKEDQAFVSRCGRQYQIEPADMMKSLQKNYNRKGNILNREALVQSLQYRYRQKLRTQSSEDTGSIDPYEAPPEAFVKTLKSDMILSISEISGFERLQKQFHMPAAVLNALLEYVWKRTNNFNYNYMDKIATVWQRNRINTLEKALAYSEESSVAPSVPSTASKSKRRVEVIPDYKESSGDDIDVDFDELEEILQTLHKKQAFIGK